MIIIRTFINCDLKSIMLLLFTLSIGIGCTNKESSPGDGNVNPQNLTCRTSNVGAKFCPDSSVPELSTAFKDEAGLIWGDQIKLESIGAISEAEAYCQIYQNRLPTIEELKRLSQELGYGTTVGYSPFVGDSEETILPNLTWIDPGGEYCGWPNNGCYDIPASTEFFKVLSSSVDQDGKMLVMSTRSGRTGKYDVISDNLQVRCVRSVD